MAYAPHHNGMVNKYNDLPLILGSVVNENDNLYEFAELDGNSPFPEYDKIIYVGPTGSESRYAKILKAVAYVVVDEDGADVKSDEDMTYYFDSESVNHEKEVYKWNCY